MADSFVLGYTVQAECLQSQFGLYDILLVTYEYKSLNNPDDTEWHPFMEGVEIEVPLNASDEEVGERIAENMILREKELEAGINGTEFPEGQFDRPAFELEDRERKICTSGLVGRRITGGE